MLKMEQVSKKFGNFTAIDKIDLIVNKNEIHAICGENGAGKSTLMKVLSGVYPRDEYTGTIYFEDQLCEFDKIRDSEETGIVIIHQELTLVSELSIMENIFLCNEIHKKGKIDWIKQFEITRQLLKLVGLEESPNEKVGDLGIGKQQLVEICKALNKNAKLLILDEPTAALNELESQRLLELMKKLQANGMTAIMISHKLNEIIQICDRVTVIRDGKKIETLSLKDGIEQARIVKGMVGRDIENIYPQKKYINSDEKILEINNLTAINPDTGRERIKDISFHLKKGEILGLAGLMGAGRSEIALSIFGKSYTKDTTFTAKKNGDPIELDTITKAISQKIAYVSEDRKKYGLILDAPLSMNMTLSTLDKISNHCIIDAELEYKNSMKYKEILKMRIDNIHQSAGSLSGGNQQKVVLAKWLLTDPDILILDEPTRGIDVGAKQEIYQIINMLAEQGKSIILISSEMSELIGLSDRVYVVNEGRIIAEMDESISSDEIMSAIVSDKTA